MDVNKDEEIRRLAQGRLLSELAARMNHKATEGGADPLKLAIHGCHDTSLAGMAQTLDVFDGRWPQFTAYISVELFKTRDPTPTASLRQWLSPQKPVHYVRMQYQNQTLKLPICSAQGNHLPGSPELCTLEAFTKRVAELTPEDWDAECRNTSKVRAAREAKGQEGASRP